MSNDWLLFPAPSLFPLVKTHIKLFKVLYQKFELSKFKQTDPNGRGELKKRNDNYASFKKI